MGVPSRNRKEDQVGLRCLAMAEHCLFRGDRGVWDLDGGNLSEKEEIDLDSLRGGGIQGLMMEDQGDHRYRVGVVRRRMGAVVVSIWDSIDVGWRTTVKLNFVFLRTDERKNWLSVPIVRQCLVEIGHSKPHGMVPLDLMPVVMHHWEETEMHLRGS
jgi:hypothetical protein